MTRKEIINEINCLLFELDNGDDAVSYLTQNDVNWLKENIKEKKKKKKWIPVTERLPENAKHKGAFCPKYYVMTEYGVTEGWYNPDVKCWYALLWFMDGRFEEWNINIDKGDIPKLVKNVPVIAWMPLPEPYRTEREG